MTRFSWLCSGLVCVLMVNAVCSLSCIQSRSYDNERYSRSDGTPCSIPAADKTKPLQCFTITKDNGLAWRGCDTSGGTMCFAEVTSNHQCKLCRTDNCNSGSTIALTSWTAIIPMLSILVLF